MNVFIYLPRGYAKILSLKLNVSIEKIYNVRRGITKDEIIYNEILLLIEQRIENMRVTKEKELELLKSIEKLKNFAD